MNTQLSFLTGAGVNLAIAKEYPQAEALADFTYQKISKRVHEIISPELQRLFNPDSFDYILGGLITINLVIEKAKTDLDRFKIDPNAFSRIFQQSSLQDNIVEALLQIEQRLTVQLDELIEVVTHFNPSIHQLSTRFDKIHYFTVNFDGLFDHMIYGPQFIRRNSVTDFWSSSGYSNKYNDRQFCIYHLHGDLRYKPNKKTFYNNPPYKWPVLVVGDGDLKRGMIGGHSALVEFHKKMGRIFRSRETHTKNNVLAIMGFGFREEDSHIVSRIKDSANNNVYDKIFVYDVDNSQVPKEIKHTFINAKEVGLIDFLERL